VCVCVCVLRTCVCVCMYVAEVDYKNQLICRDVLIALWNVCTDHKHKEMVRFALCVHMRMRMYY